MKDRLAGPALLLIIGLIGGLLAKVIGAPLPYLLGSLIAVGFFVTFAADRSPVRLYFPMPIREAFVAVIGTMIGGTFTPDGIAAFQTAWLSFAAVFLFIVVTLTMNYLIFTRIGKYAKATAYYSGMPGGLVDSVTLGEQAGGDPRILTIQHFMRIVFIITIVPLGFWLLTGDAVGSSAGVSLDVNLVPIEPLDWLIIISAGLIGYFGGKAIRLPAAFFLGPLIAAAFVHGIGLTQAQLPDWMLEFAQLVVGTGFGSRFAGMNRKMLLNGMGLGVLSTGSNLIFGLGLAWLLTGPMNQSLDVLLLCFAPGGISEMGLIALSLNANPVFVTAHHLLRILVTVGLAAASLNWIKDG